MEYDHLNYTPPANKWKPHYQRMANGISTPNSNNIESSSSHGDTDTPPIPPLPKIGVAPPTPNRAETLSTTPPHTPLAQRNPIPQNNSNIQKNSVSKHSPTPQHIPLPTNTPPAPPKRDVSENNGSGGDEPLP